MHNNDTSQERKMHGVQERLRYELQYNRSFHDIVTLADGHFRAKVNALCATPSINEASRRLGVSQPHMSEFIRDNKITQEEIKMMRLDYLMNN